MKLRASIVKKLLYLPDKSFKIFSVQRNKDADDFCESFVAVFVTYRIVNRLTMLIDLILTENSG